MFIHFDLQCDGKTQCKLHRVFRHKIKEWTDSGVVRRAVLTYHYNAPPTPDSLYVCLELPAIEDPAISEVGVSQEIVKRIPPKILECLDSVSQESRIKYAIKNYKAEIESNKSSHEQNGVSYYDGAPVEEIVRFASIGTEIAMEVLDLLEEDRAAWSQDSELSDFIFARLGRKLGSDYRRMDLALHFVCNPLGISGREGLVMIRHSGSPVLDTIKKGRGVRE